MSAKTRLRVYCTLAIAGLLAFVQFVKGGIWTGNWPAGLAANLIALAVGAVFVESLLRRVDWEGYRNDAYSSLYRILRDLTTWEVDAMNMSGGGGPLHLGEEDEGENIIYTSGGLEVHEQWSDVIRGLKPLILSADTKARWKGSAFYWVEEALIHLERLTGALRNWEETRSVYVTEDLTREVEKLSAALGRLERLLRRAVWEVTREPWHVSLPLTDTRTLRSSKEDVEDILLRLGDAYVACLEKIGRMDEHRTWVPG